MSDQELVPPGMTDEERDVWRKAYLIEAAAKAYEAVNSQKTDFEVRT
jgi:hypothetical protein